VNMENATVQVLLMLNSWSSCCLRRAKAKDTMLYASSDQLGLWLLFWVCSTAKAKNTTLCVL
jgi:hypothetical protein